MTAAFWVYINEPNDKALVHGADCSFCNNGEGMQDEKSRFNGEWHGPFDRDVALRFARQSGKTTKRWCGHCARRLGINTEL